LLPLLSTLWYIIQHPLNRGGRSAALWRFARWQISSRLLAAPIALPFINDTMLLISGGMTGATGNWYCGLHDVNDMGFLLHFLTRDDVLFDIGANIGSYTVLASGPCNARVVSVEPDSKSFARLTINVRMNGLESRSTLVRAAVGAEEGTAHLSVGRDTINAIVSADEQESSSQAVPMKTLESLSAIAMPTFIKLDVEGYEVNVLIGAHRLLSNTAIRGILIEINGSGDAFGFTDAEIHNRICDHGFLPVKYDAVHRDIVPLPKDKWNIAAGNTLYLRDPLAAQLVVKSAPRFRLVSGSI
jgi:FkbM family methyltransferase